MNKTSGAELAGTLRVAGTLLSRARGLLGRKGLDPGEGLLIRPCRGVHTFFMRFPIDVLFLDRENRVIETVADLKPQRMTRLLFASTSVMELPAGTILATKTAVGNEVVIE